MDMLNGTEAFRDSFRNMINSWTISIPEIISIMEKNIKLDPHFSLLWNGPAETPSPIIVLSSGIAPVIRALLDELLGELASDIEVVANEIQPIPPINDLGKAVAGR